MVGRAILDLAVRANARCVFVVGVGKNVGKTVAARAVYQAIQARGLHAGVASVGRDGEAADVADGAPKPRLWLYPGSVLATAREVLPRSPAVEILATSRLQTAAGPLLYARTRLGAYFELIGPPSARSLREAVVRLSELCDMVVVDGAIDRVAALAGMPGAVVVSVGASAAGTMAESVRAIAALAQRLSIRPYDPAQESLYLDGALTASRAARLIAAGERRQVIVRDPTQVTLTGSTATRAFERLRVRCIRPLRVVAATVASIGRDRSFEPRAFARAVADATGLPTFDVYADVRAA